MSLPSEYVIEDAVRSFDDVIVYRAKHPIHGTVNVYLPDDALPIQLSAAARQRLYQNGLQMRNVSLLDVPFAAKALEVSQNPNEPYIVTKYVKHDLEELISNGVMLKPKRVFTILLQVLDAITNLAANGWLVARLQPRQVKLSELHTGDINLSVIEGQGQQITPAETIDPVVHDKLNESALPSNVTEDSSKAVTAGSDNINQTSTLTEDSSATDARKQLRLRQRNIHVLADIAYRLLFGRQYEPGDNASASNIKELAGRWREIFNKAFSADMTNCYSSYKTMAHDVKRALNRNKRLAVASIPFLLLLIIIGSYFAYEQYHRHKIMTSEAGQAIKSFLEIVNKTDDKVPELTKPQQPSAQLDEEAILNPFDKIKPVDDEFSKDSRP